MAAPPHVGAFPLGHQLGGFPDGGRLYSRSTSLCSPPVQPHHSGPWPGARASCWAPQPSTHTASAGGCTRGETPVMGWVTQGLFRRGPAATERTHEGCWHGFGLLLLVQCQSVHTLVTLHLAWVCVRTHGQTGVYVCLYVMVPAFQRVFFMLFFTPFSHRFSNFLPIGDLMLM